MKYLPLLALFLIGLSSCNSQGETPKTSQTTIDSLNTVFQNYTEAIQKGEGQEALKYTSQRTLNYYDTLIFHALYSDEKELNKINILTRTAILRMRHSQSLTYWDTMTAKKLLVGMWSNTHSDPSTPLTKLADCKTGDSKATCTFVIDGQKTDMESVFYKENKEWKIDITSINPVGIEEMQNDIKHRDISETEYILLTLREMENIDVKETELYKPLKSKEAISR